MTTVASRRRTLRPNARKVLLSVHVMSAVALVGIVAAQLALAVLAATGMSAPTVYGLVLTVVHVVTIPVAALTLASSVALGLLTPWGLFTHWWVIAKTVLFVGSVVTAVTVLRPALETGAAAGVVTATPLVVLTGQLAAFGTATVLSVFKPWGRRRPVRQ
jgi:hypothetical protein